MHVNVLSLFLNLERSQGAPQREAAVSPFLNQTVRMRRPDLPVLSAHVLVH